MLAGAIGRADVKAAVLGAEREDLEHILKARQPGRQGDIECVSFDPVDCVPCIPAHQERAAVDQPGHAVVIALDRGLEPYDPVTIGKVHGAYFELLRPETAKPSTSGVGLAVQIDLEIFRDVAGLRSLDAEVGHVDVRRVQELQDPLDEPRILVGRRKRNRGSDGSS